MPIRHSRKNLARKLRKSKVDRVFESQNKIKGGCELLAIQLAAR
jgi:hypothetical protein